MPVEELGKDPRRRVKQRVVDLPRFDPATLVWPSRRFETTAAERQERRSEDLAQEQKNRLLAEFLKDPENQKLAGRMALEIGLGVGASYLTGGAAAPLAAGRIAALGTRMLATGAGEATGSLLSETFDPSEKPIQRAGVAFGTGVAGEGFGSTAARLWRGGTALEAGGREAIEQIERQGGSLAPGLVSTSRAVDIPQNIAESSLFGGGILQRMKERGVDLATEAVDEFVKKFRSLSRKEEMEDLVRETLIERSDAFRATGKALYRDLDKAIAETSKPVHVDLSKFVSDLEQQAQEFGNQGARRVLTEWRRFAKANGIEDPSTVSFADAQDIRSALLGIGRQGQDLIASGAQITGKRLSPVVDRAMARAAEAAGPEILPLFRRANAFWKQGAKRYNSRLMKSLTKEDPRAVFSAVGKNPKAIRELRNTINDPDTWREVQGQFLVDLADRSSNEAGVLSGKRLLANLKRFGEEGTREMFPQSEIDRLRGLSRTLQLAEGETGRRLPGGIFIQLQQAGAVTALGGFLIGAPSAVVGPAAAIVIAPAVMAKILSSPAVSHYLTVGLRSKPGSQQAIRAFGQIVAWMSREGIKAATAPPKSRKGSESSASALRFSAALQSPGDKSLAFTRRAP
jgi:hypothetical protein